jgi:hypothetical protein
MFKRFAAVAATGILLTMGGLAAAAGPASASTSFPVVTPIINDYDGGGQGNWANDNFNRTLNFTQEDNSYCETAFGQTPSTFPANNVCYEATVSDTGTFTTLLNAYQPNQGFGTGSPSNKTILNVVSGNFTGSESWPIETLNTDEPDPTLVQTTTLNDNFTHPSSGENSTSGWYLQAFASPPTNVLQNADWSWAYNTGCEIWVDAGAKGAGNNGFDGQSSPTSVDGNVTGAVCVTPTPTVTPTVTPTTTLPPVVLPTTPAYGDEVNGFGNGWDVFQQRAAYGNMIAGWPATQHDPATHFLLTHEGSNFRLQYAPNGVGDGLCVSNPGDNLLVLRNCNSNVWQQFYSSGGYVFSAVNNGYVNPDGTGAQLTVGALPTGWGGSKYKFVNFTSLPA